jgi:hypothetical protein
MHGGGMREHRQERDRQPAHPERWLFAQPERELFAQPERELFA